ncbi:MAG: PRC-barrel domain-containing protein, partial [Methanoregula sp.]|uniref:PRC-barrel domain-containing protein n=1 Tax=Methanoregula sp. TaxID=2052170 RepID=UPI003BB1C0A1
MDYLFNPYGIYFHLITMETQITDLFGLAIYADKGMYIGEVDDVVIDVDSKKIESLVVGKVN